MKRGRRAEGARLGGDRERWIGVGEADRDPGLHLAQQVQPRRSQRAEDGAGDVATRGEETADPRGVGGGEAGQRDGQRGRALQIDGLQPDEQHHVAPAPERSLEGRGGIPPARARLAAKQQLRLEDEAIHSRLGSEQPSLLPGDRGSATDEREHGTARPDRRRRLLLRRPKTQRGGKMAGQPGRSGRRCRS